MRDHPAIFAGTVTTTGRSSALLLEKPFFKANPEFKQRAKVTAQVVGPGFVLVGVDEGAADDSASAGGSDPVAAAYLAFLERDMISDPASLAPFTPAFVEDLDALLDGVDVSGDEKLPDDTTF